MIALNRQRATGNANPEEYSGFLRLLPRFEQLAQSAFRHLAPELAEDALADVVAFAFVTYRRLIDLGKHELVYASPLANYGIRRYYACRAVNGCTKAGDVYSQDARKRGGYTLQHLGNGQGPDAVWREMLVENSRPRSVAPFILQATASHR